MFGSDRNPNHLKLGIDIGETSLSKHLVGSHKPPSQAWRTFLDNHLKTLVSVDFFTVPTIRSVLYVFLVLTYDRRRIPHFGELWLANNLSAGNDLTFRAGETKNRGSCRSSSCPCFVSCDYS